MIDPICGMTVGPERAAGTYAYNGQNYYFCSQRCLTKFKEDPEKFLRATQGHAHHESSVENALTATDPVCGMKVDPARAPGKQRHGEEIYYFCSRRCMVKFI